MRWAPAAWSGLIALGVYALTLLRGVGSFDVAEMQTVPRVLGVAHPTGYPLWTLVGFLWSLLPLGSVAFRMNLFSAVLFAGAVGLVTRLAMKLGVRSILAVCSGLVFAFAGGTWRNAVHAEVQSLHLFLLALLLVTWVDAEQTETRTGTLVMVMCLIVGLGLSHHGTMLLTGIPLLAWFAARHLAAIRNPRIIAFSFAALGLPAMLYFYLPIAKALGAPVVNADTSQGGWLAVISGDGLRATLGTGDSISIWWNGLGDAVSLAGRWVGFPVLLLAVGGTIALAERAPGILVGFLMVIIAATYAHSNAPGSADRYLVAALPVVAALAGVFAEQSTRWVAGRAPRGLRPYATVAMVCAFTLIPADALKSGYRRYDQSRNHQDEINARTILSALPPRAVIWAYWDVRTSLQYEHFVEGVRPDVTIFDHRSSQGVGSPFAATYDAVAEAVERDPRLTGRPVCYIPYPYQAVVSAPGYTLRPLVRVGRPWGLNRLEPGWLYEVKRLSTSAG